jgi:(1->4)-alpha-D-glucan 1-alpha-D-glucosylmutase
VGSDPGRPLTDAVNRMHVKNAGYGKETMRAASTHDTKRSADARARIHVLTEFSTEWMRLARRWREAHKLLRHRIPGIHRRTTPDASAEYLLYQTLVALWGGDDLADRATDYMIKAAREAKDRTSWTATDDAFEEGLRQFVHALLETDAGATFRDEMSALVARIDPHARSLALVREAIRFTAPGVPDIYQGDEIWNHSVVDPDNRRPVDFQRLSTLLGGEPANQPDDRTKLNVVARLVALRRRIALHDAGYQPLHATGDAAPHVIAFARIGSARVITVAARLTGSLRGWGHTNVMLPAEFTCPQWRCVLSDRVVFTPGTDESGARRIDVGAALEVLPACVLVEHRE